MIAVVCFAVNVELIGLAEDNQSAPPQRLGYFGVLPHHICEIGILKDQGNLTGTEGNLVAIFQATLRCFTFDFSMGPDYYARLQDWMVATGQIERALDPANYWTNALVS